MKLAVLLCALVVSSAAVADQSTFRCGTNLVNKGDRTFQVEQKCGEPLSKEVVGYSTTGGNNIEKRVVEWLYKQGTDAYVILRFEGSRLSRIDSVIR